jgi:hypothetical protein
MGEFEGRLARVLAEVSAAHVELERFTTDALAAYDLGPDALLGGYLTIDRGDGKAASTTIELSRVFSLVPNDTETLDVSELQYRCALEVGEAACVVTGRVEAHLVEALGGFGVGSHSFYGNRTVAPDIDTALAALRSEVATLKRFSTVPERLGFSPR